MLFEPLKLPITAPSWTASDGVKFEIPQDPVWTKPLGKRLCIIDIDTRPLNGTNDILNTGDFDWPQYHPTSAGMMGHYLYSESLPCVNQESIVCHQPRNTCDGIFRTSAGERQNPEHI